MRGSAVQSRHGAPFLLQRKTMNQAESILQSIFKFEGRRGQKSYFLTMLAIFAILFVGAMLSAFVAFVSPGLSMLWLVALWAVTSIAALLVGAQRIRDFGHSGCWVFLWLLPYVGILLMIAMCFIPPTVGDNEYGPDVNRPQV
jgi:uncharacterized membrane protein YhaH (DUF805 family)